VKKNNYLGGHMDSYLLELRLSEDAKDFVKDLAYEIGHKFYVKGVTAHHVVPHVSVVGPFNTTFEKRVIKDVAAVCKSYELMSFQFDDFRSFGNFITGNRVLAVNIEPSTELKQLRHDLVESLSPYCQLGDYDKKKWSPHSTLAFKDIDTKFKDIKNYLEKRDCPAIKHYVLRLTVLKNAKILYEYDFFLKRGLTREEALDWRIGQKTKAALKDRLFLMGISGK
jgi:2'-5' RNA ligase